jgi:hypothetical protein
MAPSPDDSVPASEPTLSDTAWAPLPASRLALVLGREDTVFRARELHEVAAFARVADTRHRELTRSASRARHPAATSSNRP